jgi:hypothetical protein
MWRTRQSVLADISGFLKKQTFCRGCGVWVIWQKAALALTRGVYAGVVLKPLHHLNLFSRCTKGCEHFLFTSYCARTLTQGSVLLNTSTANLSKPASVGAVPVYCTAFKTVEIRLSYTEPSLFYFKLFYTRWDERHLSQLFSDVVGSGAQREVFVLLAKLNRSQ